MSRAKRTNETAAEANVDRFTPVEKLPAMLTPEEAFRWLGIGRSCGYDLLRRQELPHAKCGRVIRISREVLERFAHGDQQVNGRGLK